MTRMWEEKKQIVKKTFKCTDPAEVTIDGKKAFRYSASSSGSQDPPAVKPELAEQLLRVPLVSLLPRSSEILLLKELGCFYKLWCIRVLVPARSRVEAVFKVPPLEVWWLWADMHDVPTETILHGHESDGRPIYAESLICGHNMSIRFNIPFYALTYVTCAAENVTDTDTYFNQGIERTVEPRPLFERRREFITRAIGGG